MSKLMDMGRLGDLAAFEVQSRKTTSLDQLTNFLDSVVRQFGFRWFAMLHNVDLNRPGKNALLLTTYPSCWKDEIIATRLYMDDPVHAACSRTVFGLTWDRIGDYIQPTARQISILARGRAHGLATGFSMPIRMADEPDAMFTVARQRDDVMSSEDIMTARLIGAVAFEHARSLLDTNAIANVPVPLSPRQIDCIALVAQGKSDWEIAQILGLSRDTVHEYVEAARRRYGVRRRTQLVLRAVRDGHLNIETLV
ncbi:MAG: LuxR family transcriptional regulator [Alphaproteobacteria bacterium]|nr:LuxR family transcriptional regulator [Alphaproteobacteria bacterium]MBU0774326.1 LuxR family transcriptional regulator [Alphaproteobacteria bacterium]MBU1257909.1 LuxR family transcriptional regulator [Alphaproteobacteria bacterium]MBU1463821.1 LuxR family transcriptional regulator [Alphaproteobacteria bacterium]MBU1796232.1 LuxR family transcriptional regulator [Alphaproteobacteria bacterium]